MISVSIPRVVRAVLCVLVSGSAAMAQTSIVRQELAGSAIHSGATAAVTGTAAATSRAATVRLRYEEGDGLDVGQRTWSYAVTFAIAGVSGATSAQTVTISSDAIHDVFESVHPYDATQPAVTVTISSVTATGSIPIDLHFELELESAVTAAFVATVAPSASLGQSRLTWTAVSGALEYEVEWAYVDSLVRSAPADPFARRAATRLIADSLFVRYDDAFPSGTIFYRVRAVGRHPGLPDARRPGKWSNVVQRKVQNATTFEPGRTWRYTASFGEHGAKNGGASFFDGMMRQRQILAASVADSITLIGEKKYDLEGRLAVDILPAPRTGTALNYQLAFNQNAAAAPYGAPDFALGHVDPISQTDGAGRYYSPSTDVAAVGAATLPNAGGYPFRTIEYTRDNTGHVRRMSGIGDSLRIGGDHVEQHLYGSVPGNALARLFGDNGGNAGHYEEHVTFDANGQGTAKYLDAAGRLVATSLVGAVPKNLDPLSSYAPVSVAGSLLDNNVADPGTGTHRAVTMVVNTEVSNYTFTYQLTGVDYSTNPPFPNGGELCASCTYSVSIKVTDPDGYLVPLTSLSATTTEITHDFANATPPACSTSPTQAPYGPQAVQFSASFGKIGEYTVTKVLTLKAGSIDAVATNEINAAKSTILAKTIQIVTNDEPSASSCATTCEDQCAAVTTSAAARSQCVAGCKGMIDQAIDRTRDDECITLRNGLLQDVRPDGYLYEDDAWLSVHAARVTFYNRFGMPVTPNPISAGVSLFRAHWQTQWAQDLVKEHPEYCHLADCQNMVESEKYDARMAVVSTYADALAAGYLNPLGTNVLAPRAPLQGPPNLDPFFKGGGYGSGLRQKMVDTVAVFVRPTPGHPKQTLWEFASDPANYYGPDPSPPNDYKWRLFRSMYAGLKAELHAQDLETRTPACPYLDDPRAHVKKPAAFTTATQLENTVSSTEASYCSALCSSRVERWMKALSAICKVPKTKRDKAAQLLLQYCNGSCGFGNPLGSITTAAIKTDPRLQKLAELLKPCDLSLIAEPDTTERVCRTSCVDTKEMGVGQCVTDMFTNLIALMAEAPPDSARTRKDTRARPRRPLMPACLADANLTIAGPVIQLERFGERQCAIAFYDSLGRSVPAALVKSFETPTYVGSFPGTLPAGAPPFVRTAVVATLRTGVRMTLYLFSTCDLRWSAMKQQCAPEKRPADCAAAAIRLFERALEQAGRGALMRSDDGCFRGITIDAKGLHFLKGADKGSADCRMVLADSVGQQIDPMQIQGVLDVRVVTSTTARATVDGLKFAGLSLIVSVKGVTDPIVVYVYSDCRITMEDDCSDVPVNVGLPHAPPIPADACQQTATSEISFDANATTARVTTQDASETRGVHVNKCFDPTTFQEAFTFSRSAAEHHYSLYYYDQSGLLVQTVPPEGVETTGAAQPAHRLITRDQFNSLDQPISHTSVDGGTSQYWYDDAGRLRLAQNPDQKAANTYSFTQYDEQNRVTRVGVVSLTGTPAIANLIGDPTFPGLAYMLSELTRTIYDTAATAVCGAFNGVENLRGRVSASITELTPGNPTSISCYSYDAHGSIRKLQQIIAGLDPKTVEHEYDLVSGLVREVRYQSGAPDQFLQRYVYDADSRLASVLTSRDGLLWDNDARYQYFRHGVVSRIELGDARVQGLDYAFTVQGWLKSLNSATLSPARDPGHDGSPVPGTNTNRIVARDIAGLALDYYEHDYMAALTSAMGTLAPDAATQGTPFGTAARPLYDGNIRYTVSALSQFMAASASPLGTAFHYDQVGRLTTSDVYQNLDPVGNAWTSAGGSGNYTLGVQYDADGNIVHLTRHAREVTGLDPPGSQAMDDLTYQYASNAAGATISNRLLHINDAVASALHTGDIDDQGTFSAASPASQNYAYDGRGNLIRDKAAGLANIQWDAGGRMRTVVRTPGGGSDLELRYDASRNRVMKIVKPTAAESDWQTTFYVRDAGGRELASYTRTITANGGGSYRETTRVHDFSIYGKARLGTELPDVVVNDRSFQATIAADQTLQIQTGTIVNLLPAPPPATSYDRVRAFKRFEVRNHIGSVIAVISDRRFGVDTTGDLKRDYYAADVQFERDYDAFGSTIATRAYANTSYRFGFHGKESDAEYSGDGNSYDFGDRILDTRVGRWLSVDPSAADFASWSAYSFALDNPIKLGDPSGAEPIRLGETPVAGNPNLYVEKFGFAKWSDDLAAVANDESAGWFARGTAMVLRTVAKPYADATEMVRHVANIPFRVSIAAEHHARAGMRWDEGDTRGAIEDYSRALGGYAFAFVDVGTFFVPLAGKGTTVAAEVAGESELESQLGQQASNAGSVAEGGAGAAANETNVVSQNATTSAEAATTQTTKQAQVQINYANGMKAEAIVKEQLQKEGYEIVAQRVSVRTSQGRRVIDILVTDKQGNLLAVEVKSGNAVRSASQLAKDAEIADVGGTLVGKNAPPGLRGSGVKIPTVERNPP
jgi:RHS repeat-associated protein